MSKKPTTPATGIPAFEAITHMKEAAKVALFIQAQNAQSSSFLTSGKVHAALGDGAAKILKAAGVTDGSISNAAYGSKAFKRADGKLKIHLGDKVAVFNEAAYDRLSFTQARLIGQASSEKTMKGFHKPDEAALADMLKRKGWEAELDAYRKDGLTASERKEVEKAEVERIAAHPAPRMVEPAPPSAGTMVALNEAIVARSGIPSGNLIVSHIGGATPDSNVVAFPASKQAAGSKPAPATPYVHGGQEGDTASAVELWQSAVDEMRRVTDPDELEAFINTVKSDLAEMETTLEALAA